MSDKDAAAGGTFVWGEGQEEAARTEPGQAPEGAADGPLVSGRYRLLGDINGGGMGDILRVWDERMGRTSAMKVIRVEKAGSERAVERFIREAHTTGRLQHPGIVPVHDMGQLPDGRWWFTMQEVLGRTLEDLLRDLHAGASPDGWPTGGDGPGFRRLVDAVLRVCQTMAYAHVEGYVHRDLKPENVMLGRFGEVVVLDWGLGKLVGAMVPDFELDGWSNEPDASASSTRAGGVMGSPPYMAPEQARGEVASIGAPADVYALGAILYHLLAGVQPYRGRSARDIVERVKAGPPAPVERAARNRTPVPDPELASIVGRSMAREPGDRYAHAGELAAALEAWLDGTRRIEEARKLIGKARAQANEVAALSQRAEALRARARDAAASLPLRPTEQEQEPLWNLEDEATNLERRIEAGLAETEAQLQSALNLAPAYQATQQALADFYRDRLVRAEQGQHQRDATRWETLLRTYDRGRHAAWLDAQGTLDLVTVPPGAEVIAFRLVERQRRLVPVRVRSLGRTPLQRVPIPRGSILLRVELDGFVPAILPLLVEREQHVDHCPPGESGPCPIPLLRPDACPPDQVYVPAGWCLTGGDEAAGDALAASRVWIDGFVIDRHPVSVGQYREFLCDLADQGRWDEVEAAGPMTTEQGNERRLWTRTPDGSVQLQVPGGDFTGESSNDVAMAYVTWTQARAYARWRSNRTGLPWRLPHELEREKAARGVDGRIHPWGNQEVPGRACLGNTHAGPPRRCRLEEFPGDRSVYGVRHVQGGVRDWCGNAYTREALPDGSRLVVDDAAWDQPAEWRMARGSSFTSQPHTARLAARYAGGEHTGFHTTGFRLLRPLS